MARRSKVDQERYFEDFPHPALSVNNFTYVRRPLGLNNEAYELVRQEVRAGLETRSEKRTRSKVTKHPRLNCYAVDWMLGVAILQKRKFAAIL